MIELDIFVIAGTKFNKDKNISTNFCDKQRYLEKI